ncbi:MAG: siroheme synthase [Desulfobacteraceae bacterium 4572_130]|nr:MAG: siroheme synthase [Desulfobacteraceae bacterium 4572_130]
MEYYPVCLDVKNRNCLVVGGGSVGARKVLTLLKCGAKVTIVSLSFSEKIKNLKHENIKYKKKQYHKNDLKGIFLVIGATNDIELNKKVWHDTQKKNMLCNIVDFPKTCNFILPAIVKRGDLIIAVSTSGKSPAFAKKLRQDLEKEFGQEYADFLFLMGKIRNRLLAKEHAPEEHKTIFQEFIKAGLLEMIAKKNYIKINKLLFQILGKGYSYENLISGKEL